MATRTNSRPSFEARAKARAPTGERNCVHPGMTVIVWCHWYYLAAKSEAWIVSACAGVPGVDRNIRSPVKGYSS